MRWDLSDSSGTSLQNMPTPFASSTEGIGTLRTLKMRPSLHEQYARDIPKAHILADTET